jgi:hypothetical protein
LTEQDALEFHQQLALGKVYDVDDSDGSSSPLADVTKLVDTQLG